MAGDALGYDLLNNPNLVSTNAEVAWATALWFWMTQTGAGWYTCHSSMVNSYGFGQTVRTINGGIECDGGATYAVQGRIDYYEEFCGILGVTPGDNLWC